MGNTLKWIFEERNRLRREVYGFCNGDTLVHRENLKQLHEVEKELKDAIKEFVDARTSFYKKYFLQ